MIKILEKVASGVSDIFVQSFNFAKARQREQDNKSYKKHYIRPSPPEERKTEDPRTIYIHTGNIYGKNDQERLCHYNSEVNNDNLYAQMNYYMKCYDEEEKFRKENPQRPSFCFDFVMSVFCFTFIKIKDSIIHLAKKVKSK